MSLQHYSHGQLRLQHVSQLQNKTKQLRSYSSAVHGLMTMIHKFTGKVPREKSALLREYKKALEKNGTTVPGSLIQWMTESSA